LGGYAAGGVDLRHWILDDGRMDRTPILAGRRMGAVVGAGLVSVMITITVMMLGSSLEGVIWMLRMASTHASYRALRPTWMREHRQDLFIIGVVVFWIVARVRYRLSLRNANALTDIFRN
jgi:hypothetical protein